MYWEKKYPRLLSTKRFQELAKKGSPLVGISDITCDIGGSIEFVDRTASIDKPFFRYPLNISKKQMYLVKFIMWFAVPPNRYSIFIIFLYFNVIMLHFFFVENKAVAWLTTQVNPPITSLGIKSGTFLLEKEVLLPGLTCFHIMLPILLLLSYCRLGAWVWNLMYVYVTESGNVNFFSYIQVHISLY